MLKSAFVLLSTALMLATAAPLPGGDASLSLRDQLPTMSTVVAPAHTPDPFVVFHEPDGWYYAIRSKIEVSPTNVDPPGWNCWAAAQDQIIITRSRRLQDIFTQPDARAVVVDRSSPFGGSWGGVSVGAFHVTPPSDSQHRCPSAGFWAPSLKHINGRWYLFATGHRPDIGGEVNFVMESSSQDPLDVDSWQYKGTLGHALPGLDGEPIVLPTNDPQAMTVTLRDSGKTIVGQLFFVYSHNNFGMSGSQQLNLVRLQPDTSSFEEFDVDRNQTISFKHVWKAEGEAPISFPILDWESQRCPGCGFNVNEGPTALYGPDKTYLLYSASFCATKYYSLGLLEFQGEGEGFPFLWTKHPRPVFSGDLFNDTSGDLVGVTNDVFGLGHNSITVSPDLSEQWIVYHAKTLQDDGPADREARAQRFAWKGRAGGIGGGGGLLPDFLSGPLPRGSAIAAPSALHVGAVVCEGVNFTGRFCVGLEAGKQYSNEELWKRGVVPAAVRSVKVAGGASLKISALVGGGTEQAYEAEHDYGELPEEALQLVVLPEAVWEVIAAV